MPEVVRALIVILTLAATVFFLSRKAVCESAISPGDFTLRRNTWIGVTLIAFLAHNFFLYVVLVGLLLFFVARQHSGKLALFFFVLFAVPNSETVLSGFAGINALFSIGYLRLISLAILLPAYLHLRQDPETIPFGRLTADKFLAGYLVVMFGLTFIASSMTHALRAGVFYAFVDMFLPYYVASRSLRSMRDFRDALMAYALAAMILGLIGMFEAARHWLLYSGLNNALGVNSGLGAYLDRGEGLLRAQGSAGHAIPMGFVMAVAVGFWIYLRKAISSPTQWMIGLLVLVGGLVAPVSRGPWVGAAAIVLVFVATSQSPGKLLSRILGGALLLIPVMLFTSTGEAFIQLLPFVGDSSSETIDYRSRLLTIAIGVIAQNPLFGAYNYLLSAEMESLRQGQGIIDIVNTYIGIGLRSGLVGLSLFCGVFIASATGVARSLAKARDETGETRELGQMLLATILGIMVMIFTVSSITVIPFVYWSVLGMGVAYASLLARQKVSIAPSATLMRRQFQGAMPSHGS